MQTLNYFNIRLDKDWEDKKLKLTYLIKDFTNEIGFISNTLDHECQTQVLQT